ncbi:MAG: phage tail family protein [Anaerolineae bacterium]|nr:phage tail family protein [Anaerolineae bacterium]
MPITQFGEGTEKVDFTQSWINPQGYDDNFNDLVLQTQRLPGMDGAFDEYGISPAPGASGFVRQVYELNLRHSDFDTRLDTIRKMGAWGKKRLFYERSYTTAVTKTFFTWARINNIAFSRNQRLSADGIYQTVTITWQCSAPFWYAADTGDAPNVWGGFTWGTDTFGGGLTTDVNTPARLAYAVLGTRPCDMVFTLRGDTEAVNPLIQFEDVNYSPLWTVKYNGTLTDTDQLVVDGMALSVKLNGEDAYADCEFSKQPMWTRIPVLAAQQGRIFVGFESGSGVNITTRHYGVYT